jgi:hypothetical protein
MCTACSRPTRRTRLPTAYTTRLPSSTARPCAVVWPDIPRPLAGCTSASVRVRSDRSRTSLPGRCIGRICWRTRSARWWLPRTSRDTTRALPWGRMTAAPLHRRAEGAPARPTHGLGRTTHRCCRATGGRLRTRSGTQTAPCTGRPDRAPWLDTSASSPGTRRRTSSPRRCRPDRTSPPCRHRSRPHPRRRAKRRPDREARRRAARLRCRSHTPRKGPSRRGVALRAWRLGTVTSIRESVDRLRFIARHAADTLRE